MIPQLADDEIFSELIPFLERRAELSPFDAKRFERRIEAVLRRDAQSGWLLKGLLLALQWDEDSAISAAKNSLALERSAPSLLEASQVYMALNRVSDAADLALDAHALAPSSFKIADEARKHLTFAGRWQEAFQLAERFAAFAPSLLDDEVLALATKEAEDAAARVQAYEGTGLSWKQIRAETDLALEVMSKHRCRINGYWSDGSIDREDGRLVITHEVTFRGTMAEEFEVESEFSERLLDLDGWDPLRLSVEISHVE